MTAFRAITVLRPARQVSFVFAEETWDMDAMLRFVVLQRDEVTCQACGRSPAAQVHHIQPRRDGGEDILPNLVTLCGKCHMIISPVPPHALWHAFRIPRGEILREQAKVHAAIRGCKEQLVTEHQLTGSVVARC